LGLAVPPFEISYETSWGRCAWCWEELPRAETHTVLSAQYAPFLVLHLHHPCFDTYRYTSGLELAAVGPSKDWPPERLERLRITLGWDLRRSARAFGVTEGTYHRILKKDASAFGPGVQARVKQLAATHKFESLSPIDWSDSRALFCLRMTLGWKCNKLARAIGASAQQIGPWEQGGVPQRSVRTWGRLAKVAGANNFKSSNIVDDRLWSRKRPRTAIEQSGQSNRESAVAARCSTQAIQQWAAGTRPIHREASWKLTRAAWGFGVELPPVDMVGYRKGAWTKVRQPIAPEHEARLLERLKESKWTLDQVMALGTMPDRVVAEHLGKTRNSVAIMRRALGLDAIDIRAWDGRARPQSIAREELQARWGQFRNETKEKGRLARQKMMSSLPNR
jgi:transcriptional regulator with XRE-family HTH domain